MTEHETLTGGLLERLRRMGESLLALARGRAELFAVEVQEEKVRLLNLLMWFGVALALGMAGALVGIGALALWLWKAAGYPGLIGLTAVLLSAAAALAWGIRRKMLHGPTPFGETIAEFRKDCECLRKAN